MTTSPTSSSSESVSPSAKRLKIDELQPLGELFDFLIPKFQDNVRLFNGYTCRFLKQPIKMHLYSSTMAATCNSSVAVFSLPRLIRARLVNRANEILDAAGASTDQRKNLFQQNPMFLPLSVNMRLFKQSISQQHPAEIVPRTELKRGMNFHGRVALDLLGVKKGNAVNQWSMMVRVVELLMMNDVYTADADDEHGTVCTLEEPVQDEDDSEDDNTTVF